MIQKDIKIHEGTYIKPKMLPCTGTRTTINCEAMSHVLNTDSVLSILVAPTLDTAQIMLYYSCHF